MKITKLNILLFYFNILIILIYGNNIEIDINKITVLPRDLNPRYLGHLLVNETYKIAFCPIEKVMSSQFRQLFDRMAGDIIWFEHPYHKVRAKYMADKTPAQISAILHDPTWIKAIIFRDPSARLLSSYLHLIKAPDAIRRYKTMLYQRNLSTTWSDFYGDVVKPNGIRNVHWDAQTSFCGFDKFWPFFNFVGNYELIREHGPILSKLAKLDDFTRLGWALTKNLRYPIGRSNPNRTQTYLEFPVSPDYNKGDCMWCKNRAPHKTNYRSNPMSKYITEEIWEEIRNSDLYKQDYEIFSKIRAQPFDFSLYKNYPKKILYPDEQ